ncbi:MAG: hypothetical protein AAF515_20195 [Pseudomonadota bacterium]
MSGVLALFRFLSPVALAFFVVGLHIYLSSHVAPQFASVFDGFGSTLPAITKLMLPGAMFYWIAPSLVCMLCLSSIGGGLSHRTVLLLSTAITVVSFALFIAGMYLPVFQLGFVGAETR